LSRQVIDLRFQNASYSAPKFSFRLQEGKA
jgi:hypothetical protein